jgi:polynucleotide 5'-kinase involved in rRNA processing
MTTPSPAESALPSEWLPILAMLREAAPGVLLVLGAPDRGKTGFVIAAARLLAVDAAPVAIIDCDVSAGDLGPPGAVTVALASTETVRLRDLSPGAAFFAGAREAVEAPLEYVAATARALTWARAAGARQILIDTPGFGAGAAARRTIAALYAVAAPTTVVVMESPEGGLGRIVRRLGATQVFEIYDEVGHPKSPAQRELLQRTRLGRIFDGGSERRFPLMFASEKGIETLGTHLGSGEAIPPHLVRWICATLKLPVVHAEIAGDQILAFVDADAPLRASWADGAGIVAEHFGARSVRGFALGSRIGSYLGLNDCDGHLAAVGRFEGFVPETGEVRLWTAFSGAADRIRSVAFGRFRVGRDGTEMRERQSCGW